MKYEYNTEQMNSVPLKKRFHSQSKTSPTHPEFNNTSPIYSPNPTTPPTTINNITTNITTPTTTINYLNTLDSSNNSIMITNTDNSTTLPPSTPVKEEVKTEKSVNALLSSPTSTTIDALASLHLQNSASNSPSNESTTTNGSSSSTCNSSSPEDSGSKRRGEPTTTITTSSSNNSSVTDSPNSSNKKRRQFINRSSLKKKDDKSGDSESGEDSDDSENESSDEDETLYCKCNRPASYGWMIACDRCDKWFHGRCLGLKKYQANSIGTYICPECESSKKRKSTSISPSPSKAGRNSKSELSASSLAKDLPPKQITNHL